jgi:hypothetical protein
LTRLDPDVLDPGRTWKDPAHFGRVRLSLLLREAVSLEMQIACRAGSFHLATSAASSRGPLARMGRRLLKFFRPLTWVISDADWRELKASAEANRWVTPYCPYMAYVLRKPG